MDLPPRSSSGCMQYHAVYLHTVACVTRGARAPSFRLTLPSTPESFSNFNETRTFSARIESSWFLPPSHACFCSAKTSTLSLHLPPDMVRLQRSCKPQRIGIRGNWLPMCMIVCSNGRYGQRYRISAMFSSPSPSFAAYF